MKQNIVVSLGAFLLLLAVALGYKPAPVRTLCPTQMPPVCKPGETLVPNVNTYDTKCPPMMVCAPTTAAPTTTAPTTTAPHPTERPTKECVDIKCTFEGCASHNYYGTIHDGESPGTVRAAVAQFNSLIKMAGPLLGISISEKCM